MISFCQVVVRTLGSRILFFFVKFNQFYRTSRQFFKKVGVRTLGSRISFHFYVFMNFLQQDDTMVFPKVCFYYIGAINNKKNTQIYDFLLKKTSKSSFFNFSSQRTSFFILRMERSINFLTKSPPNVSNGWEICSFVSNLIFFLYFFLHIFSYVSLFKKQNRHGHMSRILKVMEMQSHAFEC